MTVSDVKVRSIISLPPRILTLNPLVPFLLASRVSEATEIETRFLQLLRLGSVEKGFGLLDFNG